MKKYKYITLFSCLCALLFTACEEEDGVGLEQPNGAPSISYVRVTDPSSSDSLLVRADLGSDVVIVGKNLGNTKEVWFNDQKAVVSPIWVTNQTIIVAVPNAAPTDVTDSLYLIDGNSDTLKYPFEVSIGAPLINSALNEWPQENENLVVKGNFFFEPITITYTGGVEGEVISISQEEIEIEIPEGAQEGPVTISTNFGEAESGFHLWDSRNIILDFDGLNPNGWRVGWPEMGDGAINGNYNAFRADLVANERNEGPNGNSETLFHYWGGGDASRTENLFDSYPGSYNDFVLKFEARVANWYGGYLNICLAPVDHVDNNQDIYSNDINARAIWGPWAEEGEEFSTNGDWITIVIPLSDFQYYIDGGDDNPIVYTGGNDFIESAAGSMSMWLVGSPENAGNSIEFHVDNIRIVEP